MNDNKAFAIIFVAAMCVLALTVIFGNNDTDIKIETEKTKQLILQYKIDSLSALQKNTIK